jgi:hypothetical protein
MSVRGKTIIPYTTASSNYSTYKVSPALYEAKLNETEPFDNHGYASPTIPADNLTDETKQQLKTDIANNQLGPMTAIANDYNGLMQNINSNYASIGTNIASTIRLRENLKKDATSGYSDYNYSLEPPIKKTVDVRLEDINDMISQTNTIYTLGTVTAMTLIIAGIFVMRE